ncbi:helix-turn-helix domain-containing protein [Streptomyces sp. NBC_00006]|uniref:excisionase family DNA-binding protein n=1 Tax=unclassified Streptomyces TaxID=2593676 RepID=UPI0022510199|nr:MULTISPECIES: helix-turn-helix domain-containing protein [unclassified Streptomyces]MCX5535774.1 helix-turn-helix domain-containing protein [Streptomyces sp. NBC_00006]
MQSETRRSCAKKTISETVAEPEPPSVRLHTADQAAELLQIPGSWLRKKAAEGAIAHTRIGRYLRFSDADLHALVTASQRARGQHGGPRRSG